MRTERVCFLCVLGGEKADPVPSSGLHTIRTCPRCKVETHDSHGFWYDVTANDVPSIVAVPVSFLECHSALDKPSNTDDLTPRVLETLTWLEDERYDMTLNEAFDVLRFSWKKMHGRTERQLILQIVSLLASQSGANPEQVKPVECKCSLRTKLVGDGCEVCNPKLAEELAQNQDDSLSDAEILKHFSKYWEHQWKDSQGNYARILQDEIVKAARALLAKVGINN